MIFSGAAERGRAAVLTNVVMLNFCYDVPVKLYSTHLLLASLFLLLPDARRLANVFVFHRPVKPAALGALFASPHLNRAAMAAKLLFVGFLFYTTISRSYQGMTTYGDLAPKPPSTASTRSSPSRSEARWCPRSSPRPPGGGTWA